MEMDFTNIPTYLQVIIALILFAISLSLPYFLRNCKYRPQILAVFYIFITVLTTWVGTFDFKGIPSQLISNLFFCACLTIASTYISHLYQIMEESKQNFQPIINSNKILHNVLDSIFNLKNHSSKTAATDFSIKSLSEIPKNGFVRIDVSHDEYTKLLLDLIRRSNTVIGTFTTIPSLIQKDESPNTKEYISTCNNNMSKIERICVFEENEIADIVGRKIKNTYPEIKWFMENIKSSRLKWEKSPNFISFLRSKGIITNSFVIPSDTEHMTDFAIFNGEILIMWRENNTRLIGSIRDKKGTMIMQIGEEVNKLSSVFLDYLNSDRGYNDFDSLVRACS